MRILGTMHREMSAKYPLVSVVVLNYNGRDVLESCISSILDTRYPKLEVIMVDNGSTDGSYKIAEKYTPKIKLQDRYFRPQDPLQKHTNNLACRWKLDMMKTISSYRVFGEDHGQHDELSNVNYM